MMVNETNGQAAPASEDDDEEIKDTRIDEGEEDPEEDNTPPKRYSVSSYGWDSDVEGLVKRLKRKDIYVPPFQRKFVWTKSNQSCFIESLILGLPVPNIFLAQDPETKRLNIVDGQQRLCSLRDYLNGTFSLSGQGIQENLKGRYFSKEVAKAQSPKVLSDADARSLSDAILHAIVIKPDAAADDPVFVHEYNKAIIQIFRRINTKGLRLTAQEVRRSIFHGPLDDLIRELNDDKAWRVLFGNRHSRLKDMELILRFIALCEDYRNYRAPMPKFLDSYMEQNRSMDAKKVEEMGTRFRKVVELIRDTIGKDGLYSGNTLKIARFDAVMTGFDAYLAAHPEPRTDDALRRLAALEADEAYQESIEKFVNEPRRVKTRIDRAKSILGA